LLKIQELEKAERKFEKLHKFFDNSPVLSLNVGFLLIELKGEMAFANENFEEAKNQFTEMN
jgi:Flp pilus assembly protein TadD